MVDDVVDTYERDGYVIAPGVLDDDLVAAAGRHVDWLQARHPDRRGEDLGHDLVADDPFWLRLVADDRLLDLAERFIGADMALFASHYISKPPVSGQPVLWHQDAGYWPLEPMEVVTLWLAVDASTPENGCCASYPVSHRAGIYAMRSHDDVASVFGNESAVVVDEADAVDIVLAPGDVEIHHPIAAPRQRRQHVTAPPLWPDDPLHPDVDPDHRPGIVQRFPPPRRPRRQHLPRRPDVRPDPALLPTVD